MPNNQDWLVRRSHSLQEDFVRHGFRFTNRQPHYELLCGVGQEMVLRLTVLRTPVATTDAGAVTGVIWQASGTLRIALSRTCSALDSWLTI